MKMKEAAAFLLFLLFFPLSDTTYSSDEIYTCLESSLNISSCFCLPKQPFDHRVECNAGIPTLQALSCVTTSDDKNKVVAGLCPFAGRITDIPLFNLTIDELDVFVCSNESRRDGRLCGRCQDGHGLAINTFGLECINDTRCHSYNWAIYFAIHFTVLSVFFLFVVTFNVKGTAECASSFTLFAQVITLPFNLVTIQRDWAVQMGFTHSRHFPEAFAWAVDFVYGIWSLNVPSGAIYKLCPDRNLPPLAALSVQYINAVFPLVLIVIAFVLIKLYQRDFKPVSLLWVPFRACCTRLRRRIDSQTSIIDAFATFVFLSYTKFTYISLILLAPTRVYNITGHVVNHVPLYDGTLDYWDKSHRIFILIAVIVLLVFVIPLPCLLFFYSTNRFQRCLHCCRLNSHVLSVFVNAFQNGFKDGSENTKDYRFFAGIIFITRFTIFALFAFVGDYFLLFTCVAIVIAINIGLYIGFQPYKKNIFNRIEPIVFTGMIVVIMLAILNNIKITIFDSELPMQIIFYLSLYFPAVYMGVYMSIWLLRKIYHHCKREMRLNVDENGRPISRLGRLGQLLDNNSSHLPSPIEDRGLVQNEEGSDNDGEYSASYIDYCQTPVGTNTGTTTDRSTVPTVSSGINTTGTGYSTGSSERPSTTRSTRRPSLRYLSLKENRIKEDEIVLAETS